MRGTLRLSYGNERAEVPLSDVNPARHLLEDGTVIEMTPVGEDLEIHTESRTWWDHDLQIEVEVISGNGHASATWPSYYGTLEHSRDGRPWEFRGPGWNDAERDGRRLALPLVLRHDGPGFLVIGTDPAYSAHISPGAGRTTIEWTYRKEAGPHDQRRRITYRTAATVDDALRGWFAAATPGVPAGPAWLHEVAWTHFDFLSKNGRGWYADVDAFCAITDPDDRKHAAFSVHGWYDVVGRYTYDPHVDALDESWIAFPFVRDPRLRALEGTPPEDGVHPPGYTFHNLGQYEPVPMTGDGVRHRAAYAKERGLRVPFYLTTGMMALGSRVDNEVSGHGLNARIPLWTGPDAIGETYLMNPLHPEVRRRFLGLTAAILHRVGDLIDALVVDEAYFVGYGQLGPTAYPGYADQAQAELLREIAGLCHGHRADIAVLTADHLGTLNLQRQAYPYCLYVDGIYHDAWCSPHSFAASRFPTWRNVCWSCNWAPVTNLASTAWAVHAFGAPISTSNGCFGDDTGIAELPPAAQATLLELWYDQLARRATRAAAKSL